MNSLGRYWLKVGFDSHSLCWVNLWQYLHSLCSNWLLGLVVFPFFPKWTSVKIVLVFCFFFTVSFFVRPLGRKKTYKISITSLFFCYIISWNKSFLCLAYVINSATQDAGFRCMIALSLCNFILKICLFITWFTNDMNDACQIFKICFFTWTDSFYKNVKCYSPILINT